MGRLACASFLVLAACPAEGRPQATTGLETATTFPPGTATEADTGGMSMTSNDATSSATSTTPDDSSTTDPPVIFDHPIPDSPNPTMEGCAKIDFVFSVDNSCSTEDDQATLQQAFPQFIQLIRDNVQGQDYHIIVVDSDGDPSWACSAGVAAQCCPDFTPGSYAFDACDLELGGGVREPHGGSASNMDCGMPAGRRYMQGDDANLDSMFSCVAQVGVSGNFAEFPIEGAVRSLENPMGCNDGFLRDDAILVMTVITDDHDGDFAYPGDAENGDPNAWYQRIVAAKNGDEDASVFIALTSNHCMGPPVAPFQQIVTLFGDQGVQGSNCSLPEMLDTFEAAVSTIATTCEDFEPPG